MRISRKIAAASYVPGNDAHFIEWGEKPIKVLTAKYKEWIVASPVTIIGYTSTEFKTAYANLKFTVK